jgi:hypothetical protein
VFPRNIAFVKGVGLVVSTYRVGDFELQILVAINDATLAFTGLKAIGDNAGRNTSATVIAVWPVYMIAAAPEAHEGKLCVQFGTDRLTRIHK